MTEQAINSSVLADWLQCATQMSNSFKAYRNSLPEGCTQRALASDLWARMDGASVNLDALRALVAEQEQASAGEPDEVDLAVKAAFERRMHAHSTNVPCEEKDCALCKKRAAEQLGDSPQFAVGDTVKVKDGYSFERMDAIVGFEGTVKEIGITIEEIDPFRNDGVIVDIPELPTREQRMYPQDLAKIAKGQA